jgi:(p)ppGpp synthase/HD superfamily hydrolase
MNDWIDVLRAAHAAARWHAYQRRKGSAEEPYINHLLEVAMLVAKATNGKDRNLVIAAVLHDAIEDQEVREMSLRKPLAKMLSNSSSKLQTTRASGKRSGKNVRSRKPQTSPIALRC